jgi:hypothetical protein
MGVLKFIDDGSIKKFLDDPTLKLVDDPSVKHADDPTLKHADDPTLKVFDDPVTIKFHDDPIGSIKTLDDLGTGGTITKAFDDVKFPAYDKPFSDQKFPGSDQLYPGQFVDPAALQSAQPFILATPHHSMAWMQTFGPGAQIPAPIDPQTRLSLYEAHLKQLKEVRQQLEKQIEQLDEYEKKVHEEYKKEVEEQKKSDKKK